ncbi:MAG: ATP-grasp domain-containing protein [Armatimonadota bacterium]
MTARPLACVMGDIDLVRALGLAGIRCAVVVEEGDPTCYSRFTEARIGWLDPWKEPEALVSRLLEFAAKQPAPPVLFYQEDRSLLLTSRYRDRLAGAFRFVVPDRELTEDLVDKARFQVLAERLELPVPRTRRAAPHQTGPDAAEGLRYPLVVKPLTRKTESWMPIAGANKALRVESPAALRELWARLAEAELEVLVQEWIDGPETAIESYHAYVDAEGFVAAEFTGKKVRTYPVECGYSTALSLTRAADVAELGRELARRMGFRGVAKLDFKRAPDGSLYLLEVNPRFNLWHHLGAVAGVNLPAVVYADLAGLPRPEVALRKPDARWCYLWYDAMASRGWGVPVHQWVPWALSCEAKSAVAIDDPMPFLRGVVWRRLSRALRRPGGPLLAQAGH